ncbi:unnamed protein product [Orchesella dallaii]|uniref:EB domain-containing protein n=1 Tax=Orchesella dallaii TaxID=48710 RepID=A0ABP1QAS2_9HEXA
MAYQNILLRWWLVLLLTICLSTAALGLTPRASFGDPCHKFTRCDSKAALTCSLGKCQCVRPEAMLFENQRSKCVVFSGERCSYTAVEMADSSEVKKWQEQVDCVSNAQCSSDGYCSCTSNFMEAINGTCIPKRLFREPCSSDGQCRSDKHLLCINGVCTCDRAISTYHLENQKCVTLAGKITPSDDYSCVSNAYRSYGYCECHSGYTTYSGLCLVPYGSSCNGKDSLCHRDMICKGGICVCRFEKIGQTFSNEKCVSKVNSPCNITIGETYFLEVKDEPINISFPCIKNAECVLSDNIYDCKCKVGFIEVNGECQIDYGQPCGGNINEKCDEIRPLECINGICQCNTDMLHYYDLQTDKCKGLVGAKCNITTTITDGFCTSGATCVPTRNLTSLEGHCRCSSNNYETTSERICLEIIKEGELVLYNSLNASNAEYDDMDQFDILINNTRYNATENLVADRSDRASLFENNLPQADE